MNCSAAILTGGLNSRMDGAFKALLKINGQSIIEWQLSVLKPIFNEIIIAGHQFVADKGLIFAPDTFPQKGPLAGIHAALSISTNPYVFIFSCDMPFLSPTLINNMCFHMAQYPCEVLLPTHPGGTEPLHAIYSKHLAHKAEEHIKKDQLSVKKMTQLTDMNLFEVNPDQMPQKIFFNVNTPTDILNASQYE